MLEKIIEEKLKKAVKQNGGVCWKFTSPGTAGVPDRIVLMPGGRIAFVEVKAPGEKPRPLQLSRHKLLRRLGFLVYVLDACEDIDKIIWEVKMKLHDYQNMLFALSKNIQSQHSFWIWDLVRRLQH